MMRSGCAFLCILGFASAAGADFSVDAKVVGHAARDATGSDSFSQDSFADSFPAAAFPMFAQGQAAFLQSASFATASATFGTVHATSAASDDDDSVLIDTGGANGAASADVQDTLRIQSSTLADGAPVSLSLAFHLTGSFSQPSRDGTGQYLADAFASLDASTTQSGNSLHLEYDNDLGDPVHSLSGTLSAQVGETILLEYFIEATSIVGVKAVSNAVGVQIDSQDGITVHSETPGVTLSADSGYQYPQAVPEASAAAGLAAALAAIACLGVVGTHRSRV